MLDFPFRNYYNQTKILTFHLRAKTGKPSHHPPILLSCSGNLRFPGISFLILGGSSPLSVTLRLCVHAESLGLGAESLSIPPVPMTLPDESDNRVADEADDSESLP